MPHKKNNRSAFSFEQCRLEGNVKFFAKCKAHSSNTDKKATTQGCHITKKRWSWIFSDNKGSWPSIYTSQQSTLEKGKT